MNDTYNIDQFAQIIDVPAQDWKGRCYEIACAIVNSDLVLDGIAVYGAWLGPVAKGSYFEDKVCSAFVRHGWILDEITGEVIDPTRWVFENVDPYIFVGTNTDGYYDRGNTGFQEIMFNNRAVPEYDSQDDQLSVASLDTFDREVLRNILRDHRPMNDFMSISKLQYFYLANTPVSILGPTAKTMFQLLVDNKLGALIPMDIRDMVLGVTKGRAT
jgi:hypothetical protein